MMNMLMRRTQKHHSAHAVLENQLRAAPPPGGVGLLTNQGMVDVLRLSAHLVRNRPCACGHSLSFISNAFFSSPERTSFRASGALFVRRDGFCSGMTLIVPSFCPYIITFSILQLLFRSKLFDMASLEQTPSSTHHNSHLKLPVKRSLSGKCVRPNPQYANEPSSNQASLSQASIPLRNSSHSSALDIAYNTNDINASSKNTAMRTL